LTDAVAVSICIPCLNGAAHLESAVRSALGQTHADVEVVICENASTDASLQVAAGLAAEDARVRVHRNPRTLPMARNWNVAVAQARGEHYVLLSADDLLAPTFVERCLAVFAQHPELGHVWTERTDIDEAGAVVHHESYFAADCLMPAPIEGRINLVAGHLVPSQALVRRACWEALGGYDERYDFCHDRHFAARVGLDWDTAYLRDPLSSYRRHAAATTTRFVADKLGVMELYRMRLDLLRERPELAELRPLAEYDLARLCAAYAEIYRAAGDARMAAGYEHLGKSFALADGDLHAAILGRTGGIPVGAQRLDEVPA
jgi:glycosyltransferase involved in cell wall biosynthesis